MIIHDVGRGEYKKKLKNRPNTNAIVNNCDIRVLADGRTSCLGLFVCLLNLINRVSKFEML